MRDAKGAAMEIRNKLRETRECRAHVIPAVQGNLIELARRRRDLAVLRYKLMQQTGMNWNEGQTGEKWPRSSTEHQERAKA